MAGIEFNIRDLKRALDKARNAIERGAAQALGDIKDDWVREARDIAPLDKGALRRNIQGQVLNPGTGGIVEVESNAVNTTGGRRFNYAYYIHEMNAGGNQLRKPGTVKKYLKESAENRMSEYERWLTEDIKDELRKAGW